jgi:hypothetical protein
VNSVSMLHMNRLRGKLFRSEKGQAVAEYAVMLILLLSFAWIARDVGYKAKLLFQWVVTNAF